MTAAIPLTPSPLAVWWMAARPKTLGAAVVPVAVGSAVAASQGGFRPLPALFALLGAVAIQVGTNLVNDAYDFEKGADTAERLGPTRVVQAGLLSSRAVKRGAFVAFALAVLAGLYLVAVAGPALIVVGIASILAGLAYTAGPYPLAYLGLGDLFVMLFFGFVAVAGTTFVQLGQVPAAALLAAVPVGALATAILAVNNLRDRAQDVVANKRTLVVRLGRSFGVAELWGLLLAAYAVPPLMIAAGLATPWALAPLVTAPLALRLARAGARLEGAALNPILAGTAQLLVLFGALFAAGLVP